jgi:hypothetical protein
MKLLALLVLVTGIASADCESRPLSAAEKDYAAKIAAALDAAAPAAPEGWVRRPTEPYLLPSPCDKRPGAFEIKRSYAYFWERAPREKDLPEYAEYQKLRDAIAQAQALTPEQNKEIDALYAASREKNSQARAAEKAGDKAAAAALRKEAEALYDKAYKLKDQYRLKAIENTKDLTKRTEELNGVMLRKRDANLTVTMVVNKTFSQPDGPTTEIVKFGPAEYKPGLKAQNLFVYVTGGDPSRQLFLNALDKAQLQAILK